MSCPANSPVLELLVNYVLSKWKCPFKLQSHAQTLLLGFGYLLNYTDLFSKYDTNLGPSPTSIAHIEDLNSMAREYVKSNLPSSEVSCSNILSAYRALVTEIRDTYTQLNYTAKLISKVHESDPSLDPEDIWIASSQERINNYTQIMSFNEKIYERKEEEYKHRAVFWKWLETVIDSVESSNEVNNGETNNVLFEKIHSE